MLLAPALTAAVMCPLMYELTKRSWISLWVGWLVGLSSHEVSQMLGHLHLTFACLVPLALWIGVRLYSRSVKGTVWRPVAGLAALLVGQFLISTDILATVTLFGCLGGVMAWLLLPRERSPLQILAVGVAAADGRAGIALSPWLWAMVDPTPLRHVGSAYGVFSLSAVNMVLPTVARLGGSVFQGVTRRFSGGGVEEASGYMGLPLLIVTTLAVVRSRYPAVCVLRLLLVAITLLALGPVLRVASWIGPALPWQLFLRAPLLNAVVTARFMLYVFILAAGLVGLYVAQLEARARKWCTAGMIVALTALAPNLSYQGLWSRAAAPPLVTTPSLLGRYVKPNASVLVLPYVGEEPSTFWQAESGFRFRLADGYLYGSINGTWALIKLANVLITQPAPTSRYAVLEFQTLLRMGDVTVVMVALPQTVRERTLLRRAGLQPKGVAGGVALWRVPAMVSAGPALGPAARFELALSTRVHVLRMDAATVVAAIQHYARSGESRPVTLARLERAHLLSSRQGHYLAPVSGWQETQWGVWLQPGRKGALSLVVRGVPRDAFSALVAQFRPQLASARFIAMTRWSNAQPDHLTLGTALLMFKPLVHGH